MLCIGNVVLLELYSRSKPCGSISKIEIYVAL